MLLLIIGIAVLALVAVDIVTIAQSKKAHYRAWKQEFEALCGDIVDDIIIRDLYDQSMDVKAAVEIYKALKEETKTNWLNEN